jgi:sterol desaturase/sphingolipid hydroxylase (fatty acid hydroxylase superfamily)
MSAVIHSLSQLPPFALSAIKLGLWLILLGVVFVPLERLFAVRRQKIARKAIWTDIGYYFLNNLALAAILALPLSLVAWAGHHYAPYRLREAAASMPLWARLIATLVVGEIGFYWGHRWSHKSAFLWRFHAVHHSAEEIDWLVNTRAHPFDMAFTRLCGLLPIVMLGLDRPAGPTAGLATAAVAITGTIWVFFIHANLRWRFGWLEWVVSTPAFHHWHHTNDQHRDRNFASLLPWIDILFGTHYMPRRAWPSQYGVDAPISPRMAGQLLNPLIEAIPVRRRASGPPKAEPARG